MRANARSLGRAPRGIPLSARFLTPLAAAFLLLIAGATLLAPWLAPYPPDGMDLAVSLQPPSALHWLGTDQLGRDVLSRTMWGGRLSLAVVLSAVVLAGTVGAAAGLIAGYRGGTIDALLMRTADIQYSLPPVILALVLVGVVGPSTRNLVIVISVANWPRFARVVRAEALTLRTRPFVLLAELTGASTLRILLRHILPNLLPTFIILATLDVGLIVILEATLSFLGLGVQPPDPSWGTMIADGRGYLERASWMSLAPGAILMMTVLSCNVLADALRGTPTAVGMRNE